MRGGDLVGTLRNVVVSGLPWSKRKTKDGRKKTRPYGVRWVTGTKQHSEWFATKALANSWWSELAQALRRGEPFDAGAEAAQLLVLPGVRTVLCGCEVARCGDHDSGSMVEALVTAAAAFFAVGYYAAARPAEGLALREDDCALPEEGWGVLMLGESRPAAGKRWTDSGEVHDRRGLKHRGRKEVRQVPIPPVLVGILRDHLDRYGVGPEGRLFRSPNGGVVSSSTYFRVWEEARRYALTPSQVASPLAGRPYDLRHAAVSLWLNGGVPAPEVAERAGHSVDVLLKVYAKCIDGQRETVNRTIEGLFGK
ncbi:hypothetical protein GCM10009660_12130 [Catellatospora bangladeshensis]